MNKKQKRIREVRRQIALLILGGALLLLILLLILFRPEEKQSDPKQERVESVEKGEVQLPPAPRYEINERCEAYRSLVEQLTLLYNMQEYVDLIMAVMMQESGGEGPDVMQSSEGAFNHRYPRVPNGITDVTYSIECGIQELKEALERVEVTGPEDIEGIRHALQAYNFGIYYLDFAEERGVDGWEEETVEAFAEMASGGATRSHEDAEIMGKWNYGDQKYPDHVLRYYKYGS